MNNWELENLNNFMGDEVVSEGYSLIPEDEAVEEKPAPSEPEESASEESSPEETAIAESPEKDKPVEEAKAEEAKESDPEAVTDPELVKGELAHPDKPEDEEAGGTESSEQEAGAEETELAHPDEPEGEEAGRTESSEQEDAVEEKEKASETPEPEPEMDPQEAAKLAQQTFIVQSTYKDMRKDLPDFRSGDTVSVGYRVIEGSRSRIQSFEGVVIKISAGHGLDKTFTVRKISSGVGVERIFPLHSPNIDSIKVLKHGKVRRAKLYYLRSRVGKATRIKERTTR